METVVAALVVVSVTGWNNALHLTPARCRQLVVSVGLTLAGLGGALWLFSIVDPERGWRQAGTWTLVAAVISGSVVILGHVFPAIARLIADRRIMGMSRRGFVAHTLVRIPVLTALTEEILFRGVVWALLAQLGGVPLAWVGSSVAFALGHVVVARQQARREGYPIGRWLSTTLAMTLVAGFVLGWLRLVTGGIWASVGVHAVVNATFAVGARSVASRLQKRTGGPPDVAGKVGS